MADGNPYEPLPDPMVTQPRSRPLRGHGYQLPPGFGRRWNHRHFARQEGMGFLLMAGLVLVAVFLFGRLAGCWPSPFG